MILLNEISGVRELLKKCIIVRGNDPLSVQANENATMLFQCFVRETFCTKLVAEKHKLSEEVSFVLQTFALVYQLSKNIRNVNNFVSRRPSSG